MKPNHLQVDRIEKILNICIWEDQLACTSKPSWLEMMMQGAVVSSSSQFWYRPTSSSDPIRCRPGLQEFLLKRSTTIILSSFPCTTLRLAVSHLTTVMSSYTAYDSMITEAISWEFKLKDYMHCQVSTYSVVVVQSALHYWNALDFMSYSFVNILSLH